MMQTFSSNTSTLRGVLAGLIPLALLSALVALTIMLTVLARQLSASQGFFVEQVVAVTVLCIGLAVATIVYAIVCVRALRRVRIWQRAGDAGRATGALWAMGLTAFLVLLPVVLAVVVPQHPAH